MKRTYRVISLCLLLALVLTAFGIFTSFAAPSAEMLALEDDKEYGNIVYDMDAQTKIQVSENTYGPNLEKNEDGYWEMNYKGYDAATAGTGGDYWYANCPDVYINNKYSGELKTEEDGTVTDNRVISNKKNTDYFVIDFDISTNSSLLDGIYFHNRWLDNANQRAQQNYVQLNGTDLDNFYISTNEGGTCIRPAYTPGEWLNVTIVYDFSSVDEYGYAIPANWKIHVYLDGIWCGNLPSISTKAVSFYYNRISTDAKAIQNGPDASTVFANFTYKTFPRGYKGPMTEAGVLGYTGATLMDIPELKYTQKNTPYSEDKLIATIERDGESIEVYKFADIDASLQDGDVVILERSISTPFLKDSNATVTFKDKNGTVLTPGTLDTNALVYCEKPYEVDFTSGKVLKINNDNPRKKGVTDSSMYFSTSVLADYSPVGESSALMHYTYVLLADIEYAAESSLATNGDVIDTDLNGHTLTLKHSTRMFETKVDSHSSYTTVRFKNGTLINSGADLTETSATSMYVFDNLAYTQTGTNPFDQRGGMIIYNNVVGIFEQALSDAKGSGTTRTGVIVKDSDITVTAASAISFENVSSSSQRQGSMYCVARVIDSKLSATAGNVFNVASYANATGTYGTDAETGEGTFTATYAAQNANDNNVAIYVDSSEIASSIDILMTNVAELRAVKSSEKLDVHEQYSLDVDFYLKDSNATGTRLLNQVAGAYIDTLKYMDNYVYDTDIRLDNTKLYLSNAEGAIATRESKLPTSSVDIVIGAEVSSNAKDDDKFIYVADGAAEGNTSVTYVAKGEWVKRGLPDVPAYTYTTNLETHSYIFNGHEYEFIAYLGDPVGVENIPQELPVESSLLKYEWQYNIDGAWEAVVTYKGEIKANVTAASDLALNVYLPATFGDAAYDKVYAEGYKVTVSDVTVDGVAYKAITIPGIDPTSATKDFTIKFTALDENGTEAVIECEISVLDYIESALKSDTVTDSGKALVASLLNYLEKAAKYNNPGAELDSALLALLESAEYTAIDLGTAAAAEAKNNVKELGVFASARLTLDSKIAYELLVKEGFSGEITLSYLSGGVTKTEMLTCSGGDVVRVEMLAYELGTPISVTYGGVSGELNLAGYVVLFSEPSAELTALADAIALYADKAAAYVG